MASTARSTTRRRSSSTASRSTQPLEAVELAKQTTYVAFDASVEAHLRLGVDPRHADQMVRGTVVLPHGTGKVVRVAVFAQGEKAQEALRAGADEVGGEDLVKKIEAGWLEFDVALATPDIDGPGRQARQDPRPARPDAEPQGRARSPSTSSARSSEVKGGRVEFRVDKAGDRPRRRSARAASRPSALRRQPRRPRRRDQPRQADRRQGPVPQDA